MIFYFIFVIKPPLFLVFRYKILAFSPSTVIEPTREHCKLVLQKAGVTDFEFDRDKVSSLSTVLKHSDIAIIIYFIILKISQSYHCNVVCNSKQLMDLLQNHRH